MGINDYNNTAQSILKQIIRNSTQLLQKNKDSLEYRALTCLARLSYAMILKYDASVQEQIEKLTSVKAYYLRREWMGWYVRFQELQTLEIFHHIVTSGRELILRKRFDLDNSISEQQVHNGSFEWFIRQIHC